MLGLLLEKLLPLRIARLTIRTTGMTVGVMMILLNIYASLRLNGWNLSLAFAGCCMLYTSSVATTTHAAAELRYFMDRKIGLEHLPPDLQEVAFLRIANPEASLSDLAMLSDPPISKSGVNHRLRKLMAYNPEE